MTDDALGRRAAADTESAPEAMYNAAAELIDRETYALRSPTRSGPKSRTGPSAHDFAIKDLYRTRLATLDT